MKIPLEERIENFALWFERRNEHPLLGFTLGSYYPLKRYHCGLNGIIGPEDIVVTDYLDDTDRLYELHEQAGGDFIFSAAPFWGVPWLEAALGCGVVADQTTGSMRSLPPAGPAVPEFSERNPWVAKMLEFIPALAARSRDRYPVGVTLMRGISDLLSALYGGENFVYRLCDAPDECEKIVERLTEFWIAFGRCLLDHLPLFHDGTGSFVYGVWCPGKLIWLQEDAAALLSPSLYQRFILPADHAIASAFDHSIMHLHPTRFIPARFLVDTDLSAIELHIDHDGPPAEALESYYQLILAKKPLYIWGDLTEADLEFVLNRLPHAGLALNVVVDSPKQANRIWQAACRRSLLARRALW